MRKKTLFIAKKTLLFFVLIIFIGCESNGKESQDDNRNLIDKIINLFGKVISENVYDLDENGEKRDIILIIEGNKMFTSNKKGDKIELLLEKFENKVHEIKHKVVDNIDQTEKGRIIYIFEGDKYWNYDTKTKGKGKLAFIRKGNVIYQNGQKGLEKILIVN